MTLPQQVRRVKAPTGGYVTLTDAMLTGLRSIREGQHTQAQPREFIAIMFDACRLELITTRGAIWYLTDAGKMYVAGEWSECT